ncbi:HD domain-containing protein [Burkholderia oklahomensis]|uniref:HD domain protein n=1 Tax=Burkholderia oklahomensis TaxID=342113 RepID=A0AAI8BFD0_9BURK|nr:HD domain-containing protein [Burkholderia oklahomensis]AIO70959.1 HD domain protein [Burkholderia oklahomensis]AOI39961.1 phosphohydrolase [Burkholderia oklahomensis EO147]KUY62123.1 phosphohydrolase [Burkholderia oklahomensis EO147]QPS39676.1 HD domain-containing protein [Burkholderia oklahomensis]
MTRRVAGIEIPDSGIACAATVRMRCAEAGWMFDHAVRSFLFGMLAGRRDRIACNAELLYVAALFHNAGLHFEHRHSARRFEIDGADAARDFLRRHGASEADAADVWDAIALHTTPGIAEHKSPLVAMMHAGVQMDVRGLGYATFDPDARDAIVRAYPRDPGFKESILEAYALGIAHRPHTTFGTVSADVLDRWDPNYRRLNFCGLVLGSDWPD